MAVKKNKKIVKKSVPAKKTKKIVKTPPKAKAKLVAAKIKMHAKKAGKVAKKSSAKRVIAKKKVVLKKAAVKSSVKSVKSGKAKSKTSAKAKTSTKTTKSVYPIAKLAAKPKASLQNFMTPLDDRILVRLTEAEKKTAGGLYIPDTVSDVSGNLEGHVVSVGRGHLNKKGQVRPMDVSLGDKIVFAEHSGSKIKVQNEDLIVLRESDVMGVVVR